MNFVYLYPVTKEMNGEFRHTTNPLPAHLSTVSWELGSWTDRWIACGT